LDSFFQFLGYGNTLDLSLFPITQPWSGAGRNQKEWETGVSRNRIDAKKGTGFDSAVRLQTAPKWQTCGKDSAESGKKNDSTIACNTLQAVTQGLETKGVLRDSAGDCSLLQ
jgi:hypothetical protein